MPVKKRVNVKPRLRIIRPSSREIKDLLASRIPGLKNRGFDVLYDELLADADWTYSAGTAELRAQALIAALREPWSDFILCARGGYGASDLLPLLPWPELAQLQPKLVIGFSDVSAIHAALYSQLGWLGLHGPMPATALWSDDDGANTDDIDALVNNLEHWLTGICSGSIPISAVSGVHPGQLKGKLFGGCFTVLTNLIGTPYFPRSLADHIVFIEDTDEHPARLMRALNQWIQSGVLNGVKAVVIGHLRNLGAQIPDCAPFVLQQFARRLEVPVFHSPLFGHTQPNYPMMIGAEATIEGDRLTWETVTRHQKSSVIRSALT